MCMVVNNAHIINVYSYLATMCSELVYIVISSMFES